MKKQVVILLLLFLTIGCNSKRKVEKEKATVTTLVDNSPQEFETPVVVESKERRNLSGVYEYVYEYNTEDFIENHFIGLKDDKPSVSGVYYGTSDDFDEAREEYLPGFFKSEMKNIILTDSTINFKLVVQDKDFFTNQITPLTEVKNNKNWEVGTRFNEREYSGRLDGDTIILRTKDFDPRKFIKRR